MKTVADKILSFQLSLAIDCALPADVNVLNPYQEASVFALCEKFYRKYYSDYMNRTLILGINPGRFGGGVTGIPFTDPLKLENNCGIPNDLQKKTELSADFIYRMIYAYGGPDKFYGQFYISSVSPLGFIRHGKNLNYYDIKGLQENLQEFIVHSLQTQLDFGMNRDICYCLGEGENFKFLVALNQVHSFFRHIIPLSHPRFIMQYRRKKIDEFVSGYLKILNTH